MNEPRQPSSFKTSEGDRVEVYEDNSVAVIHSWTDEGGRTRETWVYLSFADVKKAYDIARIPSL